MRYVIGVDEAGRGPLAGPVAVAAFSVAMNVRSQLRNLFPKREIRDSKRLAPAVRRQIFELLRQAKTRAQVSFAVSFSSAKVIDRRGIVFATQKALTQSLRKLQVKPSDVVVLLDGGLRAPRKYRHQKTIIRGDEKEAVIALASIVAKVSRDKRMISLGKKYPGYNFETHKGYGTKKHYAALKKHGVSEVHRKSFLKKFRISNT